MKGPLIIALLALLGGYLYPSIKLRLTVLGVFRNPTVLTTLQEGDLVKIEDTVQCEDLHYYEPAKVLFTACQDSPAGRFIWFPPLATFDTPLFTQGSIHVIDPKTFKSKRLAFENFKDPFFSHGIDVLTDPEDTGAVYIFAISHPPNPDYPESSHEHAASRVEIFHHVLGSETIKHLRTVRSELINTPNDIYAESPTSFFVTDDHYYRDGILRSIEDIFPSAKWSSTRHVQVLDLHSSNATGGITVTTALSDLHSQNGLGHGQTPDDILLIGASTGVLYRTKKTGTASNPTLTPIETIQLDSSLDNPSFFSDPYATADNDASGYVLAGLGRAVDLVDHKLDPNATDSVLVWHVRSGKGDQKWDIRLLYEDDGSTIRTASASVLIPIDPKLEKGQNKAWLFTTGFMSLNMIAVKVSL